MNLKLLAQILPPIVILGVVYVVLAIYKKYKMKKKHALHSQKILY